MSVQWRRVGTWQGLLVLATLLAFLIPSPSAEPEDGETSAPLRLTLKEVIQRAVEKHPSIQEVQGDVAIRRSELQQAKAGYYPTGELVNIAGVVNDAEGDLLRYRRFSFDEGLGPFTRLEGQLAYPLFTWGKLTNGVKAASKGLAQEVISIEQKKAEVVREVKELYYTLLYTQQVEELLSEVQEGLQKGLKTVGEQVKKGEVMQSDQLNLRIAYAGIAKDVAKLRNGIELTRAALLRTMGLPPTATFETADTVLKPEPAQLKDLDYYVERLFANRPEWRKLHIGIQAKEAELQVATGDYFPAFFLAVPFRYGYAPGRSRQLNPFAYDNFNFADAGPVLGLRWSLGFAETAAKVARTRAELLKLRAQEQTATASFPLEVKEAYLNVKEAEERIKITDDGRKAGRALVTLGAANIELGIGDPQEVFQGLGNYTRAANDYYEAVKDYNVALAKLSLVVGEEVSELKY
ncbi:MAG: TolC family protein [Candidatus Binatia bacterium]